MTLTWRRCSIRIIFVVHTFFPNWCAGTEVYTRSLARKATEEGHEALIVCYEPPAGGDGFEGVRVSDTEFEGLRVHRISFHKRHRSFHSHDYFRHDVEEHLTEYFSRVKPDVVHVVHAMHLTTASIWAAKKLGLPVIATATDFWLICPTYQLVKWDESLCHGPQALTCLACLSGDPADGWLRKLASRKLLTSILQPILVGWASLSSGGPDWLASLLWLSHRRSWMRKTLSQVDLLLVPVPSTRNLFTENGLDMVEIRDSGFGLEDHTLRPTMDHTRGAVLRIGYVGTFRHSKGVHVLLQAMRQLPADKVQLSVYGTPGHFPEYDRQLQELAADRPNVTFPGSFPNEKLFEVFAGLDVIVIPALWYENSPLVLLSAFALKTPVVASRVGSLADLVEHEKSGLLFRMGDPDDLARQLRKLIENPELLDRLREGLPEVKTIDRNVTELLEIYGTLHRRSKAKHLVSTERPNCLPRWPAVQGKLVASLRGLFKCVRFGESLTLLRFEPYLEGNRQICFDIQWHAAELRSEWIAFVHFVDGAGNTRFQGDHGLCHYEQDPWGFITYQVRVPIAQSDLGETYQVRLGVWIPGEARRLPITRSRSLAIDEIECVVSLGPLQVGASPAAAGKAATAAAAN